jgi:DNA-binding IclR family transcriptional regulator
MWCFGTPVLNSVNKAIAGIAVSMLKSNIKVDQLDVIPKNIRHVANMLSYRLGADLSST